MKQTIRLAQANDFHNPVKYLQVWQFVRNLGISRRKLLDHLADKIFNYDGEILTPNGCIFEKPDIDDVFGDPRWVSYFLEAIGGLPKRQCTRSAVIRLVMFDLLRQIHLAEQEA